MKPYEVIRFFSQLYSDKIGETLDFEKRGETISDMQIVSPAVSKEQAKKIAKTLLYILPSGASVECVKSKKRKGKFRAVLFNPANVFSIYKQKVANKLNKWHPVPGTYGKWEVNTRNLCIAHFKTYDSKNYISLSDDEDKNAQKNRMKAAEEYITSLEKIYPGLKINVERHKSGDVYFIDSATYRNLKGLMELKETLLSRCIQFFNKNKQLLANKNIPQDIAEKMQAREIVKKRKHTNITQNTGNKKQKIKTSTEASSSEESSEKLKPK